MQYNYIVKRIYLTIEFPFVLNFFKQSYRLNTMDLKMYITGGYRGASISRIHQSLLILSNAGLRVESNWAAWRTWAARRRTMIFCLWAWLAQRCTRERLLLGLEKAPSKMTLMFAKGYVVHTGGVSFVLDKSYLDVHARSSIVAFVFYLLHHAETFETFYQFLSFHVKFWSCPTEKTDKLYKTFRLKVMLKFWNLYFFVFIFYLF